MVVKDTKKYIIEKFSCGRILSFHLTLTHFLNNEELHIHARKSTKHKEQSVNFQDQKKKYRIDLEISNFKSDELESKIEFKEFSPKHHQIHCLIIKTEAVIRKCSSKKAFLKTLQISQKNTCASLF